MRVRRHLLPVLLAVVVMACQSGTTSTTDAPEATEAPDTTIDAGSVASFGDLPAECVEALRTYLREIEPVVEGIDFNSATMADFEELSEELEAVSETFDEDTESCPELDVSVDESLAIMREFAESEAPGTVGYLTFIEDFARGFGDETAASGDCEIDIASFQEYVDRGGSMSDLTAAEVGAASTLMSSIAVACSEERLLEWQEDVGAWIDPGSG